MISVLVFILEAFVLTACSSRSISDGKALFPTFSGSFSTHSEYKASFLDTVQNDAEVLYLGKSRSLNVQDPAGYIWSSSDESIATVQNGTVTGLKEGLVTITQKKDNNRVNEWKFAVTTFNDGRQAELCYILGNEKIAEILAPENGIPSPAYLKQNINTIQDAISYFQLSGFERGDDLPLMCTDRSEWIWFVPGDFVLMENRGITEDIATAAAYLLGDDFEDHGYVYAFGAYYVTINWFYEDGYYYVLNFGKLTKDFGNDIRNASYEILKTDDPDDIVRYALDIAGEDGTMSVVMISTAGCDFRPPMKMSYLHDSTLIYNEHVTIGFEDKVFDRSKEIYSNPAFDYEIESIPGDMLPESIPGLGSRNVYKYE